MMKIIMMFCFATLSFNLSSVLAKNVEWHYGVGALLDETVNTKTQLIMEDGNILTPWPSGSNRNISEQLLTAPDKYLFGLGLAPQTMRSKLPQKMYVEWVSYVDKKRYGVTFSLPDNLYRLNKNPDGLYLAIGTAPRGYYEVYLYDFCQEGFNVCKKNDVLITRGIAPEVVTNYDKITPLRKQYWIDEFEKNYGELIKQYPIPYWRFSLDQPPIISTYPNNVWGNREPSKEWLARMEAEKQANAPAPPPQNRCWANKNPEPTKMIRLDKSSPQFYFQRTLWEYSPELLQQVYRGGNDVDAAIVEAWDEAKQKGLNDDASEAWVLARLVGLSNYSLKTMSKQLKVKSEGMQLIEQYLAEMCN